MTCTVARAWRFAVGARLERGVRPRGAHRHAEPGPVRTCKGRTGACCTAPQLFGDLLALAKARRLRWRPGLGAKFFFETFEVNALRADRLVFIVSSEPRDW